MKKFEDYKDILGSDITEVKEFEFKGKHFKFVKANSYEEGTEYTFQCREEREELYLTCKNGVVIHIGDGHEIEDEFLAQPYDGLLKRIRASIDEIEENEQQPVN